MNTWQLVPPSPAEADRATCHAALIAGIGRSGFAARSLASLQPLLGAASWSVYQVWPDRPPRLHLSASHGVADITLECFRAYAAGLYQRDGSFDPLRRAPRPGATMLLHMTADEAPNAEHREQIYRRHDMRERLSLASLAPDQSMLAINLYRHGEGRAFGAAEIEHLAALAPVLLASVRRHIEGDAEPSAPALRQALLSRCPALTARELDVCERLLRGLSHDGIAADMGVSVATVKTYRARAFARLGLHFRSELFALFNRVH